MQEFYYKQAENGTYAVVEYHGDEQAVTVPQDGVIVSILGDKLFAGHPEITSVTLPDSITDLGEFLFDGCDRLAQLTLPPGLRLLREVTDDPRYTNAALSLHIPEEE